MNKGGSDALRSSIYGGFRGIAVFLSSFTVGTRLRIYIFIIYVVHGIFVSMYLRTSRRKNKDGSVTEYYQLAHNERHPRTRKPVARVIHNFGRADQLNRDELVRLCKSIARVCDLQVIDPLRQAEE